MATRTHAVTHSAVFARTRQNARPSDSLVETALQHELLHGVAAQDAFVALFDEFPDFEELAWEAAQAPIRPESPAPAKRERQASRRGAVARRTSSQGAKPARPPASHAKHRP